MALDPRGTAALALHRFGMGPKPGTITAIATDPRGALLAELDRGNATLPNAHLPGSAEAARENYEDRQQRRESRKLNSGRKKGGGNRAEANPGAMTGPATRDGASPNKATAMETGGSDKPKLGPRLSRTLYAQDAYARINAALRCDLGLTERLVWFWSNHFCVSAKKGIVQPIAGAYEREAIRPHVLGRFVDMLLAVETHPAMLHYLDNVKSVGPNSPVGSRRSKRGLNENLAREILELHTLGVRTVYTQDDVTSFAKVITGWTVVSTKKGLGDAGEFEFAETRHEPGPQVVIGKTYPDAGLEQGKAVLRDLATHPATARHIAFKLARHFVADDPPPAVVDRVSKRFLDSGGDLKETARALLLADESWNPERSKLKRPSEWVTSAVRAAGDETADAAFTLQAQEMLGEPLWRPGSPNGFSDQSTEWLEGIGGRINVASYLARRLDAKGQPKELLSQSLGSLASDSTQSTVGAAEDRTQALTLLFMAPEFQRR